MPSPSRRRNKQAASPIEVTNSRKHASTETDTNEELTKSVAERSKVSGGRLPRVKKQRKITAPTNNATSANAIALRVMEC